MSCVTTRRGWVRGMGSMSLLSLATILWTTEISAHGPERIAGPTPSAGQPAPPDALPIPTGWARRSSRDVIEATAPGGATVAVVSEIEAPDAASAAADAWSRHGTGQHRAIRLVLPQSPRQGWDARFSITYRTTPGEARTVAATAFRQGDRWTVVLIDGSTASTERDAAALDLLVQRVHPRGYVPETLGERPARPLDKERLEQLRRFVEGSMKALDIPGAALAVTTRDRTIYATGIGVRRLGEPAAVDADTRFAIASNTKGMATLMLAKLVDEGRVRWDEPVVRAYPGFRLGSPATTQATLIRHLVCACTGLPRTDLPPLFNVGPRDPVRDTFAQLAATEPTTRFGDVYQYNNLIVSAAGYVGGHVAYPALGPERAFDQAMQQLVWRPLGMTRTTLDFAAATTGDWALPHADDVDGRAVPILDAGLALDHALSRYGAAAGAWSTANDFARYARFELNEGRTDDGRQYVTRRNLFERRLPSVRIDQDETYGLGMIVNREDGVETVEHGGGLIGYRTGFFVVPDADVAAVILTNGDDGWALMAPFRRRLLELLYDGRPEAVADLETAAARIRDQRAANQSDISVQPAALALAALAARYRNPDLGSLVVQRTGHGVRFEFGTFASAMGTRVDDGVVSFVTLDPAMPFLPFVVGTKGGKPTLTLRDGQHAYVFAAR